jgi:hypothetical protein
MNKEREVLYFSTDIESDGPIPGPNSMLSFASVAMSLIEDVPGYKVLGTFTANLHPLEDASQDPKTMLFWEDNKAAWKAHRKDLQDPWKAMNNYVAWVNSFGKEPSKHFVAAPAGFDFTHMFWYMMKFTGTTPFGWRAIDINSVAMGAFNIPYSKAGKFINQYIPQGFPHTHIALDDAMEQGVQFCNMLNDLSPESRKLK